jgi:hypothetical protein
MTCTKELRALIDQAAKRGATVRVEYCPHALINEGRLIHDTVQVSGLKGCGPFPMPALAAAERLRGVLAMAEAA